MDEVIENVEDLNELEARLYAQIHHEHNDDHEASLGRVVAEQGVDANQNNEGNSTTKAFSKRYWSTDGEIPRPQQLHHQRQQQQINMKQQHMRHQSNLKTPTNNTSSDGGNTQWGNQANYISVSGIENYGAHALDSNNGIKPVVKDCLPSGQHINKCKKNGQLKSLQNRVPSHIPQSTNHRSELKLNPVVDWMKRNKIASVNKSSNKDFNNTYTNPKQGPFFKQQQKLEKAKRVEDKKQKSKKAKTTSKGRKTTVADVIELLSSDESDTSDVVVIPIPPPPTFTVDDSDEDEKIKIENTVSTVLQPEENALDSTDVQMSTSSSFIKPQQLTSQNITTITDGGADKRLDNSSRCTSPCSIQSSDDFIGHIDRSRLLETGSGMADDEDLLLLTTDVNSLLETPQQLPDNTNKKSTTEDQDDSRDNSVDDVEAIKDSSEFAPPKSTSEASHKVDYRVEQTQFRALDVYESESDITDSVYSKGTPKTTVIRQIDTSSDEVEDISSVTPRTKRLRKRRASSSNKGSDVNYENTQSSSDNSNDDEREDDDGLGAERTAIPFISRGPAVEHKIRKNTRTLSACSPAPNKSSKSAASKGHMSDGDFIAKLNNLVQGQDEENEAEESDDVENAPSAREIAEKILGDKTETVVSKDAAAIPKDTAAVPKDVCSHLNDVFSTIDKMEESEHEKAVKVAVVEKRDVPRGSQKKADVYKPSPNDNKAQIITYVADKSPASSASDNKPAKKRAGNGSPIYNVVYARGTSSNIGFGWNNEMRKFYEESWNGEEFEVSDVWRKMNPDKSLWRIYSEDRFSKSIKRFNNLKCTNCCEFGHARSQCKRPRKPIICYMCGESGHQEPRCPNTICLRCGNKTQVFIKGCNACSFQNRLICPICKIRGHSIDFCPDKWRRYYSTTEPNAFPRNSIVYNPKKYCSICGHRGHLSDVCRSAMHFMEYPSIATAVKSHQKSYNDMSLKSILEVGAIAFNLMYEPSQEYTFDMAERTTAENYYGRFLNAVGMDFLLNRKRRLSPEPAGSLAKKPKKTLKNSAKKDQSKAPNQVQEISESGSVDNECSKDTSNINEDTTEVESTVQGNEDIQLNIVTPTVDTSNFSNFKSPNTVTSSNNPPQILDSDSNYSFSEHFDVPPASTNLPGQMEAGTSEMQNENADEPVTTLVLSKFKQRPKPREMEELPDFIPLVDSTGEYGEDETVEGNGRNTGISKRFIMAESDDDNSGGPSRSRETTTPDGLPCEAKIYLTHFHSKYLLSPEGRNFLAKASKDCDLIARLDFTSVGHVLVIFGLPANQDKFQRELLMKYRDISDQVAQKNVQSTPNVPKRTDVLIRFLRDDINQLSSNLGNANHLYKRLQYVERQQSKSGYKLADKIRRSLNMILVGQAGLQDGNVHLDKLLLSLKTLINEYSSEEATPMQLRTEISTHWKFIFSSYRHDNYQDLLETYNNLVLKNRMTNLTIDPLLLGQKLLDTSFTTEQKEKLEQPKSYPSAEIASDRSIDQIKRQIVPNPFTPKNSKTHKRKQLSGSGNSPSTLVSPAKTPPAQSIRSDGTNMSTPTKTKSTATNSTTPVSVSKKQQNRIMPPPPFANPEKRSTVTVSAAIQQVSEKWKSTCDTLLKEISAKPTSRKGNNVRDSKLPSTFWSRESMRYLVECIPIVSSRPELMEKVKRVQNKSKSGQLSYNDYLAVIKLHTALTAK